MNHGSTGSDRLDPITTEVIARHVLAAAQEMGVTLMRTAFSPNIKERHDCSTAVFDAAGQVVAQAEHVPIHLGSMIGAIDAITSRWSESEISDGDMFVANDPYNGGGSHLPDLNVIAPVFMPVTSSLTSRVLLTMRDVGGMVPGSESAVCESIYQEGLRLPPVRLVRNGQVNPDVFDIIALNSRTPDERLGDLNAQLAANHVGIRSIVTLIERYGVELFRRALDSYLDYTERRFRAAIAALPDGQHTAEDFVSGDGDTLARIVCTVTVGRNRLAFDFTGTSCQLKCARNVPHQALVASVYTVAKVLLDPDAPANGGAFRVIDITAPAGTLVQPVAPAPVGARSLTCGVLSDVILSALSGVLPGKRMAASGPHHLVVFGGTDPRTKRYFVNYETIAGGLGARGDRDGMDAVRTLTSGSANLPIEALEHAYPLRVERYALRAESGGDGTYRGGDALVRDYRILADDVTVSLTGERQRVAAQGVESGHPGATGQFLLNPDTASERCLGAATNQEPVPRDSILRIATPGGGGFGLSSERNPDLVARDEREGRATAKISKNLDV